ncbi:hypothetical protein EON81_10835, partial [bacterium]
MIRSRRTREGGQTIIVALIILGLLLILGFVFIGIINRSIKSGRGTLQRNRTNEIAEAGIRYAHRQLLQSDEGADWRGTPTLPVSEAGQPDLTRDPDAIYLRPASGYLIPGTNPGLTDLGGPDGLGPYMRVGFESDRALVRVRYAPSDLNLFSRDPQGALRNPGAVRSYLLIESVGRNGGVTQNDPTTLGTANGVQYRNFINQAGFEGAYRQFSAAQAGARTTTISRALVSIGLTDSARWFTNKFKQTRAAELGIPADIAASYNGIAPSLQLGLPRVDHSGLGFFNGPADIGGLGSFRSNADVIINGGVRMYANRLFGDQFTVAGTVKGAPQSFFEAMDYAFTFDGGGNIQWLNPTASVINGQNLDSRSSAFSTMGGIFRDGLNRADQDGFSNGVGYQDPPSILTADPDTKETRYVTMTRESGAQVLDGNSGRYGHGTGVYVDNVSDRQTAKTEAGRQAPSARSLPQDWTDPNNRESTGWNGPFYMPRGAYLTLQNDGFTIVRDSRGPASEREWKDYRGVGSNSSSLRYKIGRDTQGFIRIVDGLNPGIANINAALTPNDFNRGFLFSGVLCFEGNVRVRGVIPTDVQLNVVSNGTIYIEGSITKGVTGNTVTAPGTNVGARLNRLSRSTLGLLAKDWVTVNTTMFFGPVVSSQPETVNDQPGLGITPVRMGTGNDDKLDFQSEFVLAPLTDAYLNERDPQQWRPMSTLYRSPVGANPPMASELLLTHAVADQASPQTFIAMNVNPDTFDTPTVISTYQFPPSEFNLVADLIPNEIYYTAYGLGGQPWQIYPKFETTAFTFVDGASTQSADSLFTNVNAATTFGRYRLNNSGTNVVRIRPEFLSGQAASDYYLGRAALAPHDIRIEALIY